ncbi:MAG: NAD(P)H-quinone oxidoreductase [Acidobacteria bacterium]|nr:NAD(P)H-quinone oxidoreductase [Acidobacteriota bacterium]
MRVVEISGFGGPDVLRSATRQVPVAGRGEVLIRVAAAGVNRPDIFQRLGKYPPPAGASDLPGLEVAGTVEAVGPTGDEPMRWVPGDEVLALVSGGGYAEFVAVPAPQCLPVPVGLTLVEAAGIPETFFTVWTNLVDRGRLASGEFLLVHGGSSGIGTTAIQMARVMQARVIVTAGSADKCAACERLGAERAINYRTEDFVAVAREHTGGRGADVILDMVGGDYLPRNVELLAVEGRLVQIALLRGARAELDLNAVMRRRLTITGSTLRPQPVAAKGAIARALETHIWPRLADGSIRPVIHATFPLERAADAHRLLEQGDHIGKVVLTVTGD